MQSKLMFLEHTVDALNEVVTLQSAQIEQLHARLDSVLGRVADLSSELKENRSLEDDRPPHY